MKYTNPRPQFRSSRTFVANLLAFLLLASQFAPLAAAQGARERGRQQQPAKTKGEPAGRADGGGGEKLNPVLAAPAAAQIVATKTDGIPQAQMVSPGDTITYTVSISNTGDQAATGVAFNDTPDANTTLVPGSISTQPVAFNDTYNAVGNVRIQPTAAQGLIANDRDPDVGNGTSSGLTVTSLAGDNSAPFAGTGSQGGQVTSSTTDGAFAYNPPAGFTGNDTFTYTVTDAAGKTDSATVQVSVGDGAGGTTGGLIWFVDDSAAAGGDGRLTSPFNCYTGASVPAAQNCFSDTAADEAGDAVFLYDGAYTGGYALLANQKLVGQGASAALAAIHGVTVPAYSEALPATDGTPAEVQITTAVPATNAVPVSAGGITLRGFTVGATTGAKIFGTAFGTLTVGNAAAPDVALGGAGQAISLTNGTLADTSGFLSVATTSSSAQGILLSQVADSGAGTVPFGSTTVAGSVTQGILVTGSTADINFGNTSVGTATLLSGGTDAISLQNNSAGTRTFGTITTQNNSAVGFLHGAGGGAVSVTGATTITNPGGIGIDVGGSNANLTFAATTVNKGSTAGTGVRLLNNASRTITFSTLAVTTSNGTGLLANTGGAINTGGGSVSATGGPSLELGGVALGLNFSSLSSTNSGTFGLYLNATSGAITTATTVITNPTGAGLAAAGLTGGPYNFGNASVTASGNTGVDLGSNAAAVTFADLDINPDSGRRAFHSVNSTGTITTTSGDIQSAGQVALEITGASAAARTPLLMTLNNLDSTNSTGNGVDLNFVSGSLTVNDPGVATNITNAGNGVAGVGIRVQNTAAGGTMSFGNTSVIGPGSTGVFLNANAGAVAFADLDISPDAGQRGLHATANTGTISSTSGTITATTGTAVEIAGASAASLTPLNMTLTQVNVNGAPSGIVLTNTSAGSGGFNVNGDNTNARNASGGVLNNTTDDAVRLTNANTVVLKSINITSPGDTVQALIEDNEDATGEHGVEAIGGGNILLSGILIDSPTGSAMIGLNLTGTNRLNNNSLVTNIDTAATHGLFLKNNNVNLTLFEVNDTDFTNSDSGASTINVKNEGTANMTVQVQGGCIFEALNNQAVTMDGGASAGTTGTLTSLVNGNIFRNAVASTPAAGVNITSENNVAALVVNGATHNATISNNTFDNIAEDGRVANTSIIRTQNSGGKLTAVVSNNTIQNVNYQTGAGGRHVIGHVFEPVSYTASDFSNLRIENNTATNVTFTATNREFLFIDYREFSSNGDIKILGNNWNMPTSAATSEAVELRFRPANPSTIDIQVDNNGRGTGAISNTDTRFFDVDAEESANVNLTVTNNTFTNLSAAPGQNVDLSTEDSATAAGSSPTMCVNISGNVLAPNTIRFNEAAGTMNVTQASSAAVTAANGGATVTVAGTPTFGAPACALPSNAADLLDVSRDTDGGASASAQTAAAPAARAQQQQFIIPAAPAPFVGQPVAPAAAAQQTAAALAASSSAQPAKTTAEKSSAKDASPDKAEKSSKRVVAPNGHDGTVHVQIGTLNPGDSVTITFQVTVNTPFPSGTSQVSNQGTVSGTNITSVLTDDPDAGGAADPTVTLVLGPPDVAIKDASAAEPATGRSLATFTVALSQAYNQNVTVNYATADGGATPATGGANCGDPNVDYKTTAGTLTFAPGQTLQTVTVEVCADAEAAEADETFLVNLSAPVNANITDAQATGTITAANPAGTTLISELRTSGPGTTGTGDANDEFVEVYNNTDAPVTVAASDASAGWGLFKMGAACGDTPVLVGTIPNGTVIPARGHYLFVGSGYSLAGYAAGDQTLAAGIEDDGNVGLFNTANAANLAAGTRLDAVGFGSNTGNNCDLLREGATLAAASGSVSEYTFVRNQTTGKPLDRNDNAGDFLVLSTTPGTAVGATATPRLGAPGPENLTSPINRSVSIKPGLVDPGVLSSAAPNRVRDTTPDPVNNSTAGTLAIRRKFTNTTGGSLTRLRFRVIDITTAPAPAGTADLRVRTSSSSTVNLSGGGTAQVQGLTLEAPPAQPNGGGWNSTLAAGTITPATPLAPGASINVEFLLGLQQTGTFRFFIIVEAVPGGPPFGPDKFGPDANKGAGRDDSKDVPQN